MVSIGGIPVVTTENIADGAVTPSKLSSDLYNMLYYVLILDSSNMPVRGGISFSGSQIIAFSPAEVLIGNSTYTKYKEVKMGFTFVGLPTYFELRSGSTAAAVYGRIYKNGVAYGTERSTNSTTYVSFSENLNFNENDLYQLYCYYVNQTGYTRNFGITGTIREIIKR